MKFYMMKLSDENFNIDFHFKDLEFLVQNGQFLYEKEAIPQNSSHKILNVMINILISSGKFMFFSILI